MTCVQSVEGANASVKKVGSSGLTVELRSLYAHVDRRRPEWGIQPHIPITGCIGLNAVSRNRYCSEDAGPSGLPRHTTRAEREEERQPPAHTGEEGAPESSELFIRPSTLEALPHGALCTRYNSRHLEGGIECEPCRA